MAYKHGKEVGIDRAGGIHRYYIKLDRDIGILNPDTRFFTDMLVKTKQKHSTLPTNKMILEDVRV